MPIAFVPNYANTMLGQLAANSVTIYIYSNTSMGSTGNSFYKYIVTGNPGGVIHLHTSRSNVTAIRWKQSDQSSGGTNLILRDRNTTRSIRLNELDNNIAYHGTLNHTVRANARGLVNKLLNAVQYQPPRTPTVGLSGVRKQKRN